MSWLSSAIKKVAPVVATFSPEPVTRGIATALSINEQKKQISYDTRRADEVRNEQIKQAKERSKMELFSNTPGRINIPPYQPPAATQQSGFLSGVGDFFSGAGNVISSAFGSGLPQLFGVQRPQGVAQQPALTSVTNVGAAETQGSGTIQAGYGSLLPTLVGGARQLLRSPGGQFGIGTGAGALFGNMMPSQNGMRVTRKMKSQAKMLLNMTGGNMSATASFLGITEDQLVFVLLKRFRNDGPVVTKAALRKTRSTVRRLKSMCDMYDDLRPRATRRAPVRRKASTTTLIKN